MNLPSPLPRARWVAWLLVVAAVAACGSTAASPSPAVTPAQTATPVPSSTPLPSSTAGGATTVTSAAQAAALVFASDPRFANMTPLQPDMVGQSAWYEAAAAGDHFTVMVTVGSGDCMAGCIDRHTWNYVVERDGTISLESEEGDEVEASGPGGTPNPAEVQVSLRAGPFCPVVSDPPDPNCADRAVANAEVVLRDPTGAEVARSVSDAEGRIQLSVPAGAYYLEPTPVDGLMGQAEPVAFSVVGGSSASLVLQFDTGIR